MCGEKLARAGDSFDGDPRAEKEIAAYENAQQVKRMSLRDRKQRERYKEILGGEKTYPPLADFGG